MEPLPQPKVDKKEWTPLMKACQSPLSIHTVRRLTKGKIGRLRVNKAAGTIGYTPLLVASVSGNTKIASILLDRGADIHQTSSLGSAPLYTASCNVSGCQGCFDTVVLLLDRGAEPNQPGANGTALVVALSGKKPMNLKTAILLLDRGADVNYQEITNDGRGSDVNIKNVITAPLTTACQSHSEIGGTGYEKVLLCLDRGAAVRPESFIVCSEFGDIKLAKLLLARGGASSIELLSDGRIIWCAIQHGRYKFIKFLIAQGVDVNKPHACKQIDGSIAHTSPIIFALMQGHSKIVKLLLKHGACDELDESWRGTSANWYISDDGIPQLMLNKLLPNHPMGNHKPTVTEIAAQLTSCSASTDGQNKASERISKMNVQSTCSTCGIKASEKKPKFKKCPCGGKYYCGTPCQKTDWKAGHRNEGIHAEKQKKKN